MKIELINAKKWIDLFVEKLETNKVVLNELDTAIGDGDHGTNMNRGAEAISAAFAKKEPENLADLYKTTAFAMIQKVGGASGPLYGTAFLDMSKAVKTDNLELGDLIKVGTDGLKRRGESDYGMKTMIDVWQPVSEALSEDKFNQQVITDALVKSKELVATKGRASYLEEKSKGHIDPGSQSSAYLFESLLEVIGD
ncbi:dihydroxyacetone kinase subunit DhaL [Companilactobacillus kimchiensis]|uniref:phosphoenolpyruvate--glycerone phosphotransferase n=1 Tax=Companilactobacillus kimchiensis TaxID=993692 RepID=A0A0R2LBS4_9LACO|nr:dihydroxyacetone kinase subunit DhaL [Companilactobacillus kimchiensis]KRN99346.1 dihydroxyacetone kinase, L subunit [Companilactobacillus kimchiensis]